MQVIRRMRNCFIVVSHENPYVRLKLIDQISDAIMRLIRNMACRLWRTCAIIFSIAWSITNVQSTRQANILKGSPSPRMGWRMTTCSLFGLKATRFTRPHACTLVRQTCIFQVISELSTNLSNFFFLCTHCKIDHGCTSQSELRQTRWKMHMYNVTNNRRRNVSNFRFRLDISHALLG